MQGQVTECEASVHLLKGNTEASRGENRGFLQPTIVVVLERQLQLTTGKRLCVLMVTSSLLCGVVSQGLAHSNFPVLRKLPLDMPAPARSILTRKTPRKWWT